MSKQYSKLLDGLLDGKALEERQAYDLMYKLAEGELPGALAGALLAGLRAKGETADEIRGFATAMRELAVHPAIPNGKPTVATVPFRAARAAPTCSSAWACRCRCTKRRR